MQKNTEKKTTKSTIKNSKKNIAKKTASLNTVKEKAIMPKKASAQKGKTQKKSTKKATSTKRVSSTAKPKKAEIVEYYDLPYRYNQTVVRILAQTPNTLFVYWDISNSDRENYINEYGKDFFTSTVPVLIVHNKTMNYSFEIEINDFANSWYINVNDANCEYKVELIRRTIKFEENLNTDYIYVSSSNDIKFPNDRILLDKLPNKINFKNVKTNAITTKDISTMRLIGINKIYKVHDFYKKFYKNEILEEFENRTFINPSSSSW